MKKIIGIVLAAFLSLNLWAQTKESTKNGAILHVWCWSFKTAEANMKDIAEAGYSAIQFSPINECLVGDYGGLEFLSPELNGKWYYHYQPTDWKIGNYQLGTRDEFISVCKEAEKYGIAVIVDVLPNHTTPQVKKVSADFVKAVGGMDKMYHYGSQFGITDHGNRLQSTTYSSGGLPDVNTENPEFQAYFMKYMNDCIDCGADGFRFDTAKHIGLPDDPKDPYSKENDFWPVFTGKKDIKGVWLKNADNLFEYGEVLQGPNSREDAYVKFLPTVASNYGGIIRKVISERKGSAEALSDWRHPGGKDNIVTWVESHDTYANWGESAGLKNFELRAGWAIVASRDGGTPLFFNRPQGAEGVQFPGVSHIGDIGNNEFKHPEVVAVNKFRTAMNGEAEKLSNPDGDRSVIAIERGNKGIVIVNLNAKKAKKLSMNVSLPDGVYKDKANGLNFTVQDGVLTGKLPKEKIAVIY